MRLTALRTPRSVQSPPPRPRPAVPCISARKLACGAPCRAAAARSASKASFTVVSVTADDMAPAQRKREREWE